MFELAPWLVGAVVFTTAAVLSWIICLIAPKIGAVAQPQSDRWHRRPTALLGGMAIFAAYVAGLELGPRVPVPAGLAAGCVLMFAVGLADDFRPLPPRGKLLCQLAAAGLVIHSGLVVHWSSSVIVRDLLTVFWLVGITNAFNLLDNMDGLAAGIAVIAATFLSFSFLNAHSPAVILTALLAAAAAGFLVFNFNPASIFMGDCGALFLGFSLGGLALLDMDQRVRGFTPMLFAPVFLLMVPILDTSLVTFARLLSGRAVSRGGRDHTSHRLVALGLSERAAVVLMYGFAAACGGFALLLRWIPVQISLWLVPAGMLLILFLGLQLGQVRVYPAGEPVPARPLRWVLAVARSRRLLAVTLDIILVLLAYYAAFLLRFGGLLPGRQTHLFLDSVPLLVTVEIAILAGAGWYRRLWRYMEMEDLFFLALTALSAAAGAALILLLRYRQPRLSLAMLILNAVLLIVFLACGRLAVRALRHGVRRWRGVHQRRVIIYGAGDRGESLLGQTRSWAQAVTVVAFLDDDPSKTGRMLRGCPILAWDQLAATATRYCVSEVLISSEKIGPEGLDRLQSLNLTPIRVVTDPSWPLSPGIPVYD